MQAIIEAINSGELAAEIKLVISNKSDAYILQRAENNLIPNKCVTLFVMIYCCNALN